MPKMTERCVCVSVYAIYIDSLIRSHILGICVSLSGVLLCGPCVCVYVCVCVCICVCVCVCVCVYVYVCVCVFHGFN